MSLLNYTTSIEAAKTVAEIQKILVVHKALSILINYDSEGHIEALSFKVETPQGQASIRLPVNPDAVLRVLERQHSNGKVPGHYVNRAQAVRIAWRIVKDWVESQMAILETEMVQMEQIFLPYILTPKGQTLFEIFESRAMLTEGETVEET